MRFAGWVNIFPGFFTFFSDALSPEEKGPFKGVVRLSRAARIRFEEVLFMMWKKRSPSCMMVNPWTVPPAEVWDAPEFPELLAAFNEREKTEFTLEQLKACHGKLAVKPWEGLGIPFKPIDIATYTSRPDGFKSIEDVIYLRRRFAEGVWMPLVIHTGRGYALFDGVRRIGIANVGGIKVLAAVLDPRGVDL